MMKENASQSYEWHNKLLLTATLIISVMYGNPSIAQGASEEVKKQAATACRNTVDAAMNRLRPQLRQHGKFADREDLVIVVPAANYNAFVDYERQRVLIPVMWCIETWNHLDALAQVRVQLHLRDKLKDYVEYLSRRQREAYHKGRFDLVPLLSFNEFARVPPPRMSDDEIARTHAAKESMMIASMTFVIGHEIGHLVLGHRLASMISPAMSRRQEREADEFSANLIQKLGESLLGAVPVLHRFLENEALVKGSVTGERTHPRAECRFERIISGSGEIDDLLRDPRRRREFEGGSGYTVPQYRALMRELREGCRSDD